MGISNRLIQGNRLKQLSYVLLGIIILQIAYGGLVAGLKAGDVSNTFPFMFGQWIPSGLFLSEKSWFLNLFTSDLTVHFIHRWLAFLVLAVTGLAYSILRRHETVPFMQRTALAIFILVGCRVLLGLGVILFSVPIPLALIHQGTGILVFSGAVFLAYQLHG
jgi:cytochrome c oxidase assembly protein subunit 15